MDPAVVVMVFSWESRTVDVNFKGSDSSVVEVKVDGTTNVVVGIGMVGISFEVMTQRELRYDKMNVKGISTCGRMKGLVK